MLEDLWLHLGQEKGHRSLDTLGLEGAGRGWKGLGGADPPCSCGLWSQAAGLGFPSAAQPCASVKDGLLGCLLPPGAASGALLCSVVEEPARLSLAPAGAHQAVPVLGPRWGTLFPLPWQPQISATTTQPGPETRGPILWPRTLSPGGWMWVTVAAGEQGRTGAGARCVSASGVVSAPSLLVLWVSGFRGTEFEGSSGMRLGFGGLLRKQGTPAKEPEHHFACGARALGLGRRTGALNRPLPSQPQTKGRKHHETGCADHRLGHSQQ